MSGEVVRKRLAVAFLWLFVYFVLQDLITILHEYAHSGAAWLLGYTSSPFTVVWGNWIVPKGWDEGVPYDQLFPFPGNIAEAVIGGVPLLMHTIFLIASLYVISRPFPRTRPVAFFVVYLFAVINLAELIAYIIMRPFIPHGDTGRFNEGMAMSPWVLFVFGTAFIVLALWVLARRVGPRLDTFANGDRLTHWAVVLATAFILFLWGSGLRMISLYPDTQWKVGLLGFPAFLGWILVDILGYRISRTGALN
jgi:hypothetical protein